MKKYLCFGIMVFSGLLSCLSLYAGDNAAAIRSLKRSTELLADSNWLEASFEAKLGTTYDPGIADFSYIEALSLAAQGAPRVDIIERVGYSLSDGLFWRSYTKNEALVFYAHLLALTCDYSLSLSALGRLKDYSGADADFVRLLDYYGLGRLPDARELVSVCLERWPFDSRFPKTFLSREASRTPNAKSLDIASLILSRLYVWEDDDRELLLLAVPFETDPARRERNIKTYRNMGKLDRDTGTVPTLLPGSALAALEYGILDETTVANEILSASETGINIADVRKLATLIVSEPVRATLASALDSFGGIMCEDANGDGIVDARIRYRLGRPYVAEFDPDQDGYPDYTVDCNLGSPKSITDRSESLISYDTYPDVRAVTTHVLDVITRNAGLREYTMRPLALKFAPVEWVREKLSFGGTDFFTIRLVYEPPLLTERLLVANAAYYVERADGDADGLSADGAAATGDARTGEQTRVTLESGVPVSSETRVDGKVTGWTSYARGFPSASSFDRDGDGYFETAMKYGKTGLLSSVTVDRNANRTTEYREEYALDGTVTLKWDSDENGVFEITHITTKDGRIEIRWIHPESGKDVSVVLEGGLPRSVSSGARTLSVLKDPFADVWWIARIPSDSRALTDKILSSFNLGPDSVVTVTFYDNKRRVAVVRTGGFLFAELLDE